MLAIPILAFAIIAAILPTDWLGLVILFGILILLWVATHKWAPDDIGIFVKITLGLVALVVVINFLLSLR